MRCTTDLLIPATLAHCFADFCGGRVNSSSTIVEEAGTRVQDLQDLCIYESCTEPSASILSRIRGSSDDVGGSVAKSHHQDLRFSQL